MIAERIIDLRSTQRRQPLFHRFEWDPTAGSANSITLTVHPVPFYDLLLTPCDSAEGILTAASSIAIDYSAISDGAEFYAVLELDMASLSGTDIGAAGLASATKAVNDPANHKLRFNLHRWQKIGTGAVMLARCREEVAIRTYYAPPRTP
jgi:hypothetical protein